MKEEVLELVDRFMKRDVLPVVEAIDKYEPDNLRLLSVARSAAAAGITHLPLPESMGESVLTCNCSGLFWRESQGPVPGLQRCSYSITVVCCRSC